MSLRDFLVIITKENMYVVKNKQMMFIPGCPSIQPKILDSTFVYLVIYSLYTILKGNAYPLRWKLKND